MNLIKSFRYKIIVYVTAIFALVLAVNTYMAVNDLYDKLLESNKNNIAANLNSAAQEIERYNLTAVTTAKMIALSQENGMFSRREETVRFMKSVAMSNPDFYDSYVIYEPNADGQDNLYRNKEWHDASGRFNAVWDNIGGRAEYTHGIDMETSLYYEGLRKKLLSGPSEKYMITEPYIYEGIMMVEHTYPVEINGKFAGIGGVDRKLENITNYLNRLKPYKSADFLLISRLGGIVVNTSDTGTLTKKYTDLEQGNILEQFLTAGSENNPVKIFYDPKEKGNYLFGMSIIKTGDWKLFIRVSEAEIMAPVTGTIIKEILVALAFLVGLFFVLLFLVKSIVKPVMYAADTARKIASGDLTVQIDGIVDNEVGVLLTAFRNMTSSLNSIVLQVQRSGVRIVSSSTEIFASTKNLLSIASGQAEFANQVLTATKEISATSNALANTINDVGTVSERTKDSVKDSSKLLDRMENTIDMMLDATKTISQKLGIINEKANSIGTIITTIHKIAEQTNLLSLNASIEAEKAGDYGRGFSVIAREIRRLADQTSQSTKNIEIMVYDMQSAVNVGVLEMDKFTQEIRNGASEMDNVNANLECVISSVQELAPRFQEVSESMQFQLKGVDNINDSIIKLSQGARIIEDSLGEFNAVTTELKEEAESLKKEIARFKVGAGN